MLSELKRLLTPKKLWVLRLYITLLTYLVELLLIVYVGLSAYNLISEDNVFGDLIIGYAGFYLVWVCLAILFVTQVVSLFLNVHDNIEDLRNNAINPDFSIDVASEREKNKESSISSFVTIITIILAVILSFVNLNRDIYASTPIIDFRAFAVGKNIVEGMEIPEGAPQDEYEMIWIYKVDGVEQRFTADQAPWDIPGAEFVDREQKLIKKGYEPPIHDFSITVDGYDMLPELMEEEELFLVVCYRIDKTSTKNFGKINALAAACEAEGIKVIGLSASSPEIVEQFRHDNQASFPFGSADETALKTVIRSNPGVVYIQKGTVKGQWHHNDTPTLEQARLLAK